MEETTDAQQQKISPEMPRLAGEGGDNLCGEKERETNHDARRRQTPDEAQESGVYGETKHESLRQTPGELERRQKSLGGQKEKNPKKALL